MPCKFLSSLDRHQRHTMKAVTASARLVILYGFGGLSDVGRHAVQVAIEKKKKNEIEGITVLTPYPDLLDETNWNCGCPNPHGFSKEEKQLFQLVQVKDWGDKGLLSYFKDATAVISCVGNRQPTFMNVQPKSWEAFESNQMVIQAMKEHGIKRAVVMSSMGVEEDWPPMEFHWAGKIMACFFLTCVRKAYKDLTNMERAYRSSDLDYLLVRPVGIGEEVLPENKWHLQTEKYKDNQLDGNMAKLDVARYMMEEALSPTRHQAAVVIGGVLKEDEKKK